MCFAAAQRSAIGSKTIFFLADVSFAISRCLSGVEIALSPSKREQERPNRINSIQEVFDQR
jgi:hypothetical protein